MHKTIPMSLHLLSTTYASDIDLKYMAMEWVRIWFGFLKVGLACMGMGKIDAKRQAWNYTTQGNTTSFHATKGHDQHRVGHGQWLQVVVGDVAEGGGQARGGGGGGNKRWRKKQMAILDQVWYR